MFFQRLGCLLALACVSLPLGSGCGGASPDGDDDDTPFADGGPVADAGPSILAPINGRWDLEISEHDGDSRSCAVAISGDALEVTCAGDDLPRQVGEACMQLREDEHVVAALDEGAVGQMSGRREQMVQYDGEGCAVMGHTTGAAYPTTPSLLFGAQQQQFVTLDLLLGALGGRWQFHLDDPAGGEQLLGCTVDLAMALPAGVAITAECPGETSDGPDGCSERETTRLESTLEPGHYQGSLVRSSERSGSCSGTSELFRYDFSATPVAD